MNQAKSIRKARHPWWMYVLAAIYLLTFLFNLRQEFMGPSASGWAPAAIPIWPDFKVVHIRPGSPMEAAGLKQGDVLEAVDGHPLTGVPDWFLARANFEINRPVQLEVRRGEQHLMLRFVIPTASWQIQGKLPLVRGIAVYLLRLVPLVIAIVIAFRRPWQISARLAALMLATASVAEGYPSPGWAAALHHLPLAIAVPIALATASWLLAPVVWLSFFAIFPRPWLSRRWRFVLAFVPLAVFLPALVASVIAMVRDPWSLAATWPAVFSAPLVHGAQALAGVAPLFFFNHWPLAQPMSPVWPVKLWFGMAIVYLAAGWVMLAARYRQLEHGNERRLTAGLLLAMSVAAVVTIHNFLVRNWFSWFGTTAPAVFSPGFFAVEAVLFQVLPIMLVYAVLKQGDSAARQPAAWSI